MTTRSFESSCHCGAVRLAVDTAPIDLNECNCSICRRYGTLWAYYAVAEVRIEPPSGATDVYMWAERSIEFHRCKTCGCVTHWAPADGAVDRMGINARLMDPALAASTRIRHSNGAAAPVNVPPPQKP